MKIDEQMLDIIEKATARVWLLDITDDFGNPKNYSKECVGQMVRNEVQNIVEEISNNGYNKHN
jgi:hypothetical protein